MIKDGSQQTELSTVQLCLALRSNVDFNCAPRTAGFHCVIRDRRRGINVRVRVRGTRSVASNGLSVVTVPVTAPG